MTIKFKIQESTYWLMGIILICIAVMFLQDKTEYDRIVNNESAPILMGGEVITVEEWNER